MENINTLLVAFMFITILTLGIAGVLTALAELVRRGGSERRDVLLIGWACLLLFAYFTLFWHTADIALVDDWRFGLFLFAETGPVLLLFASQLMLGAMLDDDSEPGSRPPQGRFFVIFGLLQVWSVTAGFVLGLGFTIGSALSLLVLVTCLVLAGSKSRRVQAIGLGIVWLAYLAGPALNLGAG